MRIDSPVPEQLPELLAMWKTAFGEYDGFWEMFLDVGFEPDHCRCVTADGQTAAALYWFDCTCQRQKIAYIYAVVTHPGYRNRGLCRLLLEDVHSHLAKQGYAAAMLVPAEAPLRQMYEKLGYQTCTTVSEFSCTAGDTPISLRAMGPEEYAQLRRHFLPEGGVLQEGKNLDFLSQQAQFYTGDNFLLAAYADNGVLTGMELLGNREAAPGILTALGCASGTFRTPGEERPFAMFHPLSENAVTPQYFGFAFD